MFEIEKDIPMPDTNRGHRTKYPWHLLEVGDSFFVASEQGNGNAVRCAGFYWAQRHGNNIKFTAKKVEGGTRIWRIK